MSNFSYYNDAFEINSVEKSTDDSVNIPMSNKKSNKKNKINNKIDIDKSISFEYSNNKNKNDDSLPFENSNYSVSLNDPPIEYFYPNIYKHVSPINPILFTLCIILFIIVLILILFFIYK